MTLEAHALPPVGCGGAVVQPLTSLSIVVQASDEKLRMLVEGMVAQAGLAIADNYRPGIHLVVDNPLTWAFTALEALPKRERAFAVVSTPATHAVYRDCLMSYRPSGAFFHTDATGGIAALYAAAVGAASYTMTSGLTLTELRIVRLLLQGHTTKAIAAQLCVKCSTINTHFSSILRKTGCCDRAQLVVRILGNDPNELDKSPEGHR
jgi:DNA-binding CsgD family transcriptional regulator